MSDDIKRRVAEAYRAIRKNRNTEADKILENVLKGGYDPYPLFLSALAAFNGDHIDIALSLVKRLRSYYPDYLPGRELDAYIRTKSAATSEDAVVAYVELSPSGSESKYFARMADKIRHAKDFSAYQRKITMRDCVRISRYSPRSRFAEYEQSRHNRDVRARVKKSRRPRIAGVIVGILIIAVASFAMYLHGFSISDQSEKKDIITRSDIPFDHYPLIGKMAVDEKYSYSDETTLRRDYEEARKLIKSGEYNNAIKILNRILLSNAQPGVKDRAGFLHSYITGIADRPADEISCDEISLNPLLYRGTMIRVVGTVVDVIGKGDGQTMTVVPDRYGKRILEVFYNGKISCGKRSHVIVEGKFSQTIGKDSRLYVEAHAIDVK
ncbi:MAG TPA: hypothetical protein VF857_06545 [Spirochaetota bacterium]